MLPCKSCVFYHNKIHFCVQFKDRILFFPFPEPTASFQSAAFQMHHRHPPGVLRTTMLLLDCLGNRIWKGNQEMAQKGWVWVELTEGRSCLVLGGFLLFQGVETGTQPKFPNTRMLVLPGWETSASRALLSLPANTEPRPWNPPALGRSWQSMTSCF